MEVVREVPLLRWLRKIKRLVKIFVFLSLTGCAALLFLILYLRSQPLPVAAIEQTTTIYASGGEVLGTIHHGKNRMVVPLREISPHLLHATVAMEDRRFWNHYGLDLLRTAKAVYIDLIHMEKRQGASSITQQLARNLYLSLEKTWERKIKEALLAIQLELNYSKEEILEMYMNQIYYGYGAYGAETAAQTYFGKRAKDLTLAESAMLAGIPKGPTYYSPFADFAKAKSRQKLVLQAMQREGYITAEEAERAYREQLDFASQEERKKPELAPYFQDFIATLAKEKYGIDEELFRRGGLKIYTTLDIHMQKKAEEAIAKHMPKDNPELQTALVAMDPQTGEIKAMVGGRDYTKSQYNRVFSKRQPGSSFKPFLYLTALENGYTPLTMMKSEPTVFTYEGGKTYVPRNFGDHYPNDYISLQQAIATSDNIYAVKAIEQLTPSKVVETAKRAGIQSPLQPVLSLALGTSLASPYEMTAGYATIANGGKRVTPIAILKIEDDRGNVLVEEKPKQEQAFSPVSTFLLTTMLQTVFEPGGTAYRVAHQLNRPVAGKTGTTDYDAWLSGYSPQLVATVWVGYDSNKKVNAVDARLAAPIWADFMEGALQGQPPSWFEIPEGVTSVYINPQNNKLATEDCPEQRLMFFRTGTQPQEYCTLHLPNPNSKPVPAKKKEGFWDRISNLWSP